MARYGYGQQEKAASPLVEIKCKWVLILNHMDDNGGRHEEMAVANGMETVLRDVGNLPKDKEIVRIFSVNSLGEVLHFRVVFNGRLNLEPVERPTAQTKTTEAEFKAEFTRNLLEYMDTVAGQAGSFRVSEAFQTVRNYIEEQQKTI